MNKFRALIVLVVVVVTTAQQCTYDYECGNMPYRLCTNSASDCTETLDGVVLSDGFLYYAQRCRSGNMFGNITMKRVSASGSVAQDINTRQVVPAAFNPAKVLGAVGNYLFYDIALRQPGVGLRALNFKSNVEYSITTESFLQPQWDFDLSAQSTYTCNYRPSGDSSKFTIDRYNIIPTAGALPAAKTLYNLQNGNSCGPLRRYGPSTIYFVDHQYSINGTVSAFYKGTTSCSNCQLPRPFFVASELVIDFDLSNNFIFYSTESGLYRLSMDGSVRVLVESGRKNGIVANGKIIYYNTGSSIRSINEDGSNSKLLSLPKIGSCACKSLFQGDRCENCTGQVQWDSYGQPECVPIDLYGVPQKCAQDYQCGNPPYTVCYSKCQCRPNFTGPKCDVCDAPKQITWDEYGVPHCDAM